MINIDFLTIKAFLNENIDFIINSRVQKIQQPSRRDFILYLRNNSQSRKLYINIMPEIYHIAFMSAVNESKRNLQIPKQPPMFCMLLRKYLEGAKISDACVVENERILELYFEAYDELGQIKDLCLCIEFMGKHSNVILYEKASSLIIGCAHNVGSEKSRYRELKGGLKYIYPPRPNSLILSNELKLQFDGLSPEKINKYLEKETYSPAINDDRYTLFSELLPSSIPQPSVNDMLDNYYSDYQEKTNTTHLKKSLEAIVNAKLRKINSSISKINLLLKKRDNADRYKLYGELLTANLYLKADFQKEIALFDYINGTNVKIELDISKSMNENAQRYFKLYTKSKNTREKSEKILQNLEQEKNYLESILYAINASKTIAELNEIQLELDSDGKQRVSKHELKIEKVQINGFDVYIGKNNRQNDFIISKLSKDEDYWFHTRLCAGSHVLLKVNETEPDEETIFKCACLAREFSSAKQPSKVGVIYTKRKFVKKPPSAPLGYVIYKNEKEILI